MKLIGQFRAAGVAAGIKKKGLDLGLLYHPEAVATAAVYTRNQVQAAPLQISRQHLAESAGRSHGIILNSGNANALTGAQGLDDARQMTALIASQFGLKASHFLVLSTGVIGNLLPMAKIEKMVPNLKAELTDEGSYWSRAMLTTDSGPKTAQLNGRCGTIQGFAKGSGMIHPNMATMLGVLITDAQVPPDYLQPLLQQAVARSFNRITVDGDTSTNDCVVLMCEGSSPKPFDPQAFAEDLESICRELALKIVADGEGARKTIAIRVHGAAGESEAEIAAKTIAGSLLVKTAMHGADANWGRILAALGRSPIAIDPDNVVLQLGPFRLFEAGRPLVFDETQAKTYLQGAQIAMALQIGSGPGDATVWTCDLSAEYVAINADYRT